jgi:hypothetical protein
VIRGTVNGDPVSETLNLSQTAGSVTSVYAYDGDGIILDFEAADAPDATLAVGYGDGIHNSADNTNGVTAADATYGTLKTGDTWSESKTTPPMWDVSDLYAAGPPATGAFAEIASHSAAFAYLVISEPVAQSDITTLSAGLNYLETFGKRPTLLVRFRDPEAQETDAEYTAAFRTFRASNHDSRIAIVAGHGWLTDALRGHKWFRSGLPAVLARLQSNAVVPGARGERIAQHPGYVARGPLENFSIVDDSGVLIQGAHDELLTGGIDGPIASTGGGITFYYQRLSEIRGTYVSEAPVMYGPGSAVLSLMDRRLLGRLQSVAEVFAWLEIKGANIYDPETFALDQDTRDAIQTKIGKVIRDRYALEFQNPDDPNLVAISETVAVDGDRVTIAGTLNVRLFNYTHVVALTFSATR